ncbi:MAG: multiheme c-type cytochrome [Anaerolineae bacterium]
MTDPQRPKFPRDWLQPTRVLVIGLVSVAIVVGLALMIAAIAQSLAGSSAGGTERIDALATSNDDCVVCHRDTTPGIVQQYGYSTMAAADVACGDCHVVPADYPGAVEHEGTYVLGSPTPARCEQCHTQEVAQFNQSRHGLPSYVAMVGVDALSGALKSLYESIPEAAEGPDQARNALYQIEGPAVTRFACEACHNIGQPLADGSVGQCQKCHLRHEFSLEQVRKPETCNACHIGPDHPQWEIYQESPHGIAYATGGERWHWSAEPGTLTTREMPAATCAICHISGFGGSATTHDVGERLSWYLFSPVSKLRPAWEDNRERMQNVCRECHNEQFIAALYTDADALVEAINGWVGEGGAILGQLKGHGLLTDVPFDEPVDFTYFELWHHWGRTAKFGAWMQGPDYTQWHGAYEMLSDLAELEELAGEETEGAGQ